MKNIDSNKNYIEVELEAYRPSRKIIDVINNKVPKELSTKFNNGKWVKFGKDLYAPFLRLNGNEVLSVILHEGNEKYDHIDVWGKKRLKKFHYHDKMRRVYLLDEEEANLFLKYLKGKINLINIKNWDEAQRFFLHYSSSGEEREGEKSISMKYTHLFCENFAIDLRKDSLEFRCAPYTTNQRNIDEKLCNTIADIVVRKVLPSIPSVKYKKGWESLSVTKFSDLGSSFYIRELVERELNRIDDEIGKAVDYATKKVKKEEIKKQLELLLQ